MSEYQKYWNSEIEKLLVELEGSEELHACLAFILSNSQLTQIFPNQIVNALKAAIQIKNGEKNIALVAPMQSGKSGTIFVLCNYVLPFLKLIKKGESIVFVTSMTDTDLFDQNKKNLEKDFFCPIEQKHKSSFVRVKKMGEFFRHPNPHKIVRDYKVRLIVRDEDQYGCGQESSFDNAFFLSLRSKMPNIKLLSVSATPYDILDAKLKGAPVEVINGERPKAYFGITEMIELGLIENYPSDFTPTVYDNDDVEVIHPKLDEYINHLLNFEDGLGIIRVSNTNSAIATRELVSAEYKQSLECVVIGSNAACDYSIQEGLSEVKRMVLSQQKRVVLIVVNALSAGKDLRLLKSKVRFGVESRNKQLANGAQGIAGRLCGYHENRDFKILASMDLLSHYSQFEQDWEVFADENWRNELYNLKVRGLTTQTRFKLNRREGIFTPINEISFFSKSDLNSAQTRSILSFLDDESFNELKKCFEPEFYNSNTSSYKLNQEGVTVRIASSYNQKSNRVYKNWGCSLESDFGSVFFKNWTYEFGILISNFPVDDERNTLGICGFKVIKSGLPFRALQDTSVISRSMYAEREDETIDSLIGLISSNKIIENV